jgi:hypothetical protein
MCAPGVPTHVETGRPALALKCRARPELQSGTASGNCKLKGHHGYDTANYVLRHPTLSRRAVTPAFLSPAKRG